MDFHCDGKINYHEFLAATISTIHFNKEEKLWSVFKYFDTNDTGYITAESVIDALKESGVMVNEEGLRDTFKEFKAIAFKSFGENEEDIDNKNNEKNFIKINYSNKNVEIENNLNLEKSNETSEIREIPED